MPYAHRLLTALAIVALSGCASLRKADPAPPLVRTEVVTLPQSKLVEVTGELTEECPIAEGPLSQVVEIARMRKEALQGCANAKLRAIRELVRKAVAESAGE